jgi:hypothetical protein
MNTELLAYSPVASSSLLFCDEICWNVVPRATCSKIHGVRIRSPREQYPYRNRVLTACSIRVTVYPVWLGYAARNGNPNQDCVLCSFSKSWPTDWSLIFFTFVTLVLSLKWLFCDRVTLFVHYRPTHVYISVRTHYMHTYIIQPYVHI